MLENIITWKNINSLLRYCNSLTPGDCIDLDLGMESGRIQDNNIIASSAISQTKNGRLSNARAWCAVTADNINPFLQIDLRTLHIICAVSTQGNPEADQWVETYTLQVSTDGSTWTDYKEDGQVKVTTEVNVRALFPYHIVTVMSLYVKQSCVLILFQ